MSRKCKCGNDAQWLRRARKYLCEDCAKAQGKLVKCDGEAHSNPYIDNCIPGIAGLPRPILLCSNPGAACSPCRNHGNNACLINDCCSIHYGHIPWNGLCNLKHCKENDPVQHNNPLYPALHANSGLCLFPGSDIRIS